MNPETFLKSSSRPDLAAHHWERIKPHLPGGTVDADGIGGRCLLSLLGNSPILVDHLLSGPDPKEQIHAFLHSRYLESPKPRDRMLEELTALRERLSEKSLSSVQEILRVYKYQEMTRIAARDLSGIAAFEETGAELSSLASAACEIAYQCSLDFLKDTWEGSPKDIPPFTVLGMGKLGGGDLNFSSDIDLLYVHGNPAHGSNPSDSPRSVFEFFCRLCEATTKILHERTQDGIVFRVDLDLRPEGKNGVIVNSLEALSSYYEASGAAWERGALIKARPIAGSASLGRQILSEVEPFVYPKHVDASVIHHLKEMKAKINSALFRGAPNAGFNLKLGRGGIREIEFFVTAFQMIYGGGETRLRERNTLKALDVIKDLKLAPGDHLDHLREAYVFLRRAENRLQMEEERQVHSLPKDNDQLEALARRCGYEDAGTFTKDLEKHTSRVSEYFESLAS